MYQYPVSIDLRVRYGTGTVPARRQQQQHAAVPAAHDVHSAQHYARGAQQQQLAAYAAVLVR